MECYSDANFPLLHWYFKKLNLQPSADAKEFLDYLTHIYGEAFVNKLLLILEKRLYEDAKENEDELYSFKNQTLNFSLDFARYSANLYDQFLAWFLTQKFSTPGRLLDLGCDNGITTCFFGLLFPDSEVIGVDICKNAVHCATELAGQFGLKNVRFITTDLTNLRQFIQFDQHGQTGSFDMIVSLRSLQEIYEYFPEEPLWPADSQSLYSQSAHLRSLSVPERFAGMSAISDSLRNKESTFITCERILGLDQCVFFTGALRKFNMHIEFAKSSLITFHELGEIQEMPVFIAKKEKTDQSVFEAISGFYRKGQNIILEPGYEYEGPIAELAFSDIGQKQLLDSVLVKNEDDSIVHYELWQSQQLLFRYQYSNTGYRELHIFPPDSINIAKQGLHIIAAMNNSQLNL